MAFAFDSLSFTKHLETAGVDRKQAEAHAEAVRNYVMSELVTKEDMRQALKPLESEVARLDLAIDNAVNRMTIRLGSMIAAAIGLLAVLQKLL